MKFIVALLCVVPLFAQKLQPTGQFISPNPIAAHNGSYTVATTDLGGTLTLTGATTATWVVPQCPSTGFATRQWFTANNTGSGVLTMTTSTSVFYGGGTSGTSMTLSAGTSATLTCDGANWAVSKGGGGGSASIPGTAAQITTADGAGGATASTCTSASGGISCPGAGGVGGELDLYDTGSKFWGFKSPTTITGSGCIFDLPAGDPAGQVLQFAAPSSGHCAGSWVSAGGGGSTAIDSYYQLFGDGDFDDGPSITFSAAPAYTQTMMTPYIPPSTFGHMVFFMTSTGCNTNPCYVQFGLYSLDGTTLVCKTTPTNPGTSANVFVSLPIAGGTCTWPGGGAVFAGTTDTSYIGGIRILSNTLAPSLFFSTLLSNNRAAGYVDNATAGTTGSTTSLSLSSNISAVSWTTNAGTKLPWIMLAP